MMNLELFPSPSVRIARVDSEDAKAESDLLGQLSDQLFAYEDSYPGIRRWFKEKVKPGLLNGQRLGFVGYHSEEPVLAGVLKKSRRAKFCHLSIRDGFRGNHLGQLMFSLMAAEIRGIADEVHFTLPESLWFREQTFFKQFGFLDAVPAHTQYRLLEEELRCSASWKTVWGKVVAGLPSLLTQKSIAGRHLHDGVVLSLKPTHAQAIIDGQKTVEIRRRFSNRWEGRQAAIYSCGSGTLLGTADIERVVAGPPEEIWHRFGSEVRCEKAEFDGYVSGCDRVFALRLADPNPYEAPVPLSQLAHLIGTELAAPQSYASFSSSNQWGRALSVAALLHRRSRDPRVLQENLNSG